MRSIFASPMRVLLLLSLFTSAGIYSGWNLPVSLFPNSSKPEVGIWIRFGSLSRREFLDSYGRDLEARLAAISGKEIRTELVQSRYFQDGVRMDISFPWGVSGQDAKREVTAVVNSYSARLPEEIRDSVNIWDDNRNTGFLAISYYSDRRSLEEVYNILEPVLLPKLAKVEDAAGAGLYNPKAQEILVELNPVAMASLKLFPAQIANSIRSSLKGHGGGSVRLGSSNLSIQMPRPVQSIEDLGRILIHTSSGKVVHLNEVAHVDLINSRSHQRSFKTNGAPSLILFANPKPGGNIKRMAEAVIHQVELLSPSLPKDIKHKVLVDPSHFIRRSIRHVLFEVAIGAGLAVAVLFFFVGSFRNTVTALCEIPLSMILAFILMKTFDMNLNLVSLGGLALAAGMNVDASVVVMENIFRHLELAKQAALAKGAALKLSFQERLTIITRAVSEVRFAIVASTIASLVVFIPLTFTSDLTYAVLGDLAKAVVFSHGIAALIALFVVPTVRLYLMERWPEDPPVSPIHGFLSRVEQGYVRLLKLFLDNQRLRWRGFATLGVILLAQLLFLLPHLPKEIIGKPETDWMVLKVNTQSNTLIQQMESQAEEIEARMLDKFGSSILYTFSSIRGINRARVMARLKNKGQMDEIWKKFEKEFQNTPYIRFSVGPWNPAELPIPDPPHFRASVRGGELKDRARVARELRNILRDQKIYPRVWTKPDADPQEGIVVTPHQEQWVKLAQRGVRFRPDDLADLARVATTGRRVGQLTLERKHLGIHMQWPQGQVRTEQDLKALPIGVEDKLLPLKALADVEVKEVDPGLMREDLRALVLVEGKLDRGGESNMRQQALEASLAVKKLQEKGGSQSAGPIIHVEDSQVELNQALEQLLYAVSISILLIFITMVLQFSSIAHALLVLAAVPLGIIGVLFSLWIFGSTLSLNSVLGIILLNGIAVANSIILVDFMKRLVNQGWKPRIAAVEAARTRMRPILITSLTTVLGMLPIALGFGEGGKVLQPLGIAVSGGLWVSTLLTLFVVPVLQVMYLERRQNRSHQRSLESTKDDLSLDVRPVVAH